MSLNLFNLSGRLALVTGSSQGIGLAMAAGLARAGAHVVLNGRDPNKLEIAAKSLIDEGLTVSTSAFDVSDSHAVEIAVAAIEENSGPSMFSSIMPENNTAVQRKSSLMRLGTIFSK